MSSLDQVLATFEPISLAGANDIAELQTRIDRKYLVDECQQGSAIISQCRGAVVRCLEWL